METMSHSLSDEMCDWSRKRLYSAVNALNRENNRLKTDFIQLRLISHKYRQYFTRFGDKTQTVVHLDDRLREEIRDLNAFYDTSCLVLVDKLPSNCCRRSDDCMSSESITDALFQSDHKTKCHMNGQSKDVIIGDIVGGSGGVSDPMATNGLKIADKCLDKVDDSCAKSERKYVCDYMSCDKSYTDISHLKRHQLIHSGRVYRCGCDGCSATFTSPQYLDRHVKRQHPKYQCDCKTGIITSRGHQQMKAKTNDKGMEDVVEPFTTKPTESRSQKKMPEECDWSDEDMDDNSEPKGSASVSKYRKVDGKYICDINSCHKKYADRRSLREHQMSHSGKRFYCYIENCCKHFAHKSSLRIHLKTGNHVFGQPFACVYECGFNINDRKGLEEHIMSCPSTELQVKPMNDQTVNTMSDKSVPQKTHHSVDISLPMNSTSEVMDSKDEDYFDFDMGFDMNGDNDSSADEEPIANRISDKTSDKLSTNEQKVSELSGGQHSLRCDFEGCSAKFNSKHNLLCHKRIHIGKDLVCGFIGCDFKTKINSNLHRHKQIHRSATETETFVCDYIGCGKEFSNRSYLLVHKRSVHSGRRYACEWPGCSSTFTCPRNLTKHMNRVHRMGTVDRKGKYRPPAIRKYVCDVNECNKAFLRPNELQKHQLRLHPQEFDDISWMHCAEEGCAYKTKIDAAMTAHTEVHTRPYVCEECNKNFPRLSGLKTHLKSHPENIGLKLRCEWHGCERVFTTKWERQQHMNVHSGEKQYECDWPGCERTFLTKPALWRHRRRHSNPRIQEKVKETRRKWEAMKRKSGEAVRVPCDWYGCERTFNSKSAMKDHMNIHTGDRPYECTWPACGKRFLTKQAFHVHKRRHTIKDYVCKMPGCDYQSTTRTCYSSHMKKKHNMTI